MIHTTNTNSKFSKFWTISLIACFFMISMIYVLNNFIPIEDFSKNASLPAYTIIPGILVILSFWTLYKHRKIEETSKLSLLFLTFAFFSWFVAEQVWSIYEHVLKSDPYPSIADYFYISAPILMFFSLILFLHPLRKQIPKKNILFAIFVSTFLLIPSLLTTYNFVGEDEDFEIFIALIYPTVDALLLVPAIIAILFSFQGHVNRFWSLILLGLLIFVTADTLFLFLIIDDSYFDGHPIDVLWLSSYVLWCFTMYYILHKSKNNQFSTKESKLIFEKYKMQSLNKYGITVTLIIVNISTWILIYGINFSWEMHTNSNTMYITSIIFGIIIAVFSIVIMYFHRKTNSLLEERTQKLQEALEELIKSERFIAIGELSARVAHDIRNPLSVIRIALENLKFMYGSDETKQKQFDKVDRSIERIIHQTEGVLDFVKKKPIVGEKTKVSDLIAESLDSLKIPKNIRIVLPKNDALILCDKQRLAVAINNIILNSIQSIKNTGLIAISLEEEDDSLKIEIEDSGPGISKENLDKIFIPLFTTKQQGTGLGLISVKSIIESHHGTISVKSPPTIFTITLPKVSE